MTEKQLRRLRRPALIELLIEQIEENERLEARLSEANDQLRNREITISNAGSIAEALYGVPAWLKEECRRRLPADFCEVLRRFDSLIRPGETV